MNCCNYITPPCGGAIVPFKCVFYLHVDLNAIIGLLGMSLRVFRKNTLIDSCLLTNLTVSLVVETCCADTDPSEVERFKCLVRDRKRYVSGLGFNWLFYVSWVALERFFFPAYPHRGLPMALEMVRAMPFLKIDEQS